MYVAHLFQGYGRYNIIDNPPIAAKWSPTLALDPIMQPLAILGLANKRGEISLWR